MKLKLVVPTSMLALSLTGCLGNRSGVALLGLDSRGKPLEIFVNKETLSQSLGSLMDSVNETTLLTLENSSEKKEWFLRTAVVGLGVKIEAGLGPFVKVSATPRLKLAFSNQIKPVVP